MMEKIKNIIDSLCALIKGIFMEKKEEKKDDEALPYKLRMIKFVEELPDKPEPNVVSYYIKGIWTYDLYQCVDNYFMPKIVVITSQGRRLVLSIIQILICIIDALICIIDAMQVVCGMKNKVNDFNSCDCLMCLMVLKSQLRDKFHDIMQDEDNSCDNSILKSIKIVL